MPMQGDDNSDVFARLLAAGLPRWLSWLHDGVLVMAVVK